MRYLACVLFVACGNADVASGGDPVVRTQAITDGVIVVHDAVVADDYVELPQEARIRRGDFIASADGDGFLRRVEQVDGRRIWTSAAAIADAVKNGDIDSHLELEPIVLDLSGTALADGVTLSPLLITVTPVVDLKVEIRDHQVKSFATRVTMARSTHVGVTADVAVPISTGDKTLYTSPKWRFVQWVGPVPIVEVVSFVLQGGAQGTLTGQLSVSAACERDSAYEVVFADGEWTAGETGDGGCDGSEYSANVALAASLEGYLRGTLAVDFYGIAGPFLALRDGLKADVVMCPGQVALSSPARLSLGADLSKLGAGRYETTLYSHTFAIGEWPLPTDSVCQ